MLRYTLLALFCLLSLGAAAQGPEVRTLNIQELKARMAASPNKVLVVNFWATWCRPCVAELPHFEQLADQYKTRNVEVLLVTIDSPADRDTKVRPLLQRRNIKSETVLLAETDPNTWIPQLSADWDGALPATAVVVGGKLQGLQFHAKSFTYEELEALVKPLLN